MRERIIGCVIGLLLFFAYAHNGFDTLAWKQGLGAYTANVLFHAADAERAQLFVQLSEDQQAAPEATQVRAEVRQRDVLVYEGEVPFAGSGSADGRTFYRGYLLTLPLSEAGMYEINLNVSGPLGVATASYFASNQRGRVSALEILPSLILLLTVLGGAALLFAPLKRPTEKPLKRKDGRDETPHNAPSAEFHVRKS